MNFKEDRYRRRLIECFPETSKQREMILKTLKKVARNCLFWFRFLPVCLAKGYHDDLGKAWILFFWNFSTQKNFGSLNSWRRIGSRNEICLFWIWIFGDFEFRVVESSVWIHTRFSIPFCLRRSCRILKTWNYWFSLSFNLNCWSSHKTCHDKGSRKSTRRRVGEASYSFDNRILQKALKNHDVYL